MSDPGRIGAASARGTPPLDPGLVRAAIEWDVRNWSRALAFWQPHLDARKPRNALAIGERSGGLSLWLAAQGIDVVCSDRGMPLETARRLHERFGVEDRVTYEDQDVTAIGHPDGSFDLVGFKSVIGALGTRERQAAAIGELHRVLAPGGLLIFAENLAATRLHAFLRSRFVAWDRGWRYIHLEEERDMLGLFSRVETETWGLFGLLGRTEGQRDLLGRIDSVLAPHASPGWRYILFAACRKAGDPTGATSERGASG